MKKITFNIPEDQYNLLGEDKTEVNKKAKELLLLGLSNPIEEVQAPNQDEHRLLSKIRGYLEEESTVTLHVLHKSHGRVHQRLKLSDL